MALADLMVTLEGPLALGSQGPEVKALQKALNDWNDNANKPLVVDGRFGKSTHRAVCVLQFVENMKEDGVVGPKTAEVLGLNYSRTGEKPFTIRYDEPPRPPMTPPLALLADMVAASLDPLRSEVEDAILLAPSENKRAMKQHQEQANGHYEDLVEELKALGTNIPAGNVASAKVRTAFQIYIKDMHSELEAAQFHARGGWIWRFHPVLDKLPVDSITGPFDRVLRGEQSVTIAIAQMRLAFDQFNRLADVPRYDANGVGPEGKAFVT